VHLQAWTLTGTYPYLAEEEQFNDEKKFLLKQVQQLKSYD